PVVLLGGSLFVSACAQAESDPGAEHIGEATLAITTVPTGILCIRFIATPAAGAAVTINQAVTGGSASGTYSLGQLPLGNVTFTGNAYSVACNSVSASTAPQWIADPATATLQTGAPATVPLTFRRNNPVTGGASFVDNLLSLSVGIESTVRAGRAP